MLSALILAALPITTPYQEVLPGAFGIVVAGQSNAAGAAPMLPEDLDPIPGIYALRKDGVLSLAVEPLDTKPNMGAGFGRPFAVRWMETHPEVTQVYIIHCGFAGTTIKQWQPALSGGIFEYCGALINGARNMGIPINAVLWHQGEQDAAVASTTAYYYSASLKRVIVGFRAILGNVPFVAGEIGRFLQPASFPARTVVVSATSSAIAQSQPAAFVLSTGLNHKGDRVHFDRPAQMTLGARYADALALLLPGNLTVSICDFAREPRACVPR